MYIAPPSKNCTFKPIGWLKNRLLTRLTLRNMTVSYRNKSLYLFDIMQFFCNSHSITINMTDNNFVNNVCIAGNSRFLFAYPHNEVKLANDIERELFASFARNEWDK